MRAARFEEQYPSIGPLIVAVADWFRKHRGHHASSELADCTPHDVERIAADIGLTVADLRKLEEMVDDPLLLYRMLAALKIDEAELARADPAAFRDLQRVCAMCDSKRRCDRELQAGDAPATFEAFCPNALTLKSLT